MGEEWKIGEIRKINNEWYQCVNQNGCCNCAFYNNPCHLIDELSCNSLNKKRKEKYIFKKLEKVGEQFLYKGILMQPYRRATDALICNWNNSLLLLEHGDSDIIDIEIKQSKEDMEENKLNLKPFDIQKAKEGKPVCTRDGRKARIICFDAKGKQPIIALFEKEKADEEIIQTYSVDGRYYDFRKEDHRDLMMLPEKRSGWVNIYRGQVYNTFEKAEEARKIAEHGGDNCLKTIKIDWEE